MKVIVTNSVGRCGNVEIFPESDIRDYIANMSSYTCKLDDDKIESRDYIRACWDMIEDMKTYFFPED